MGVDPNSKSQFYIKLRIAIDRLRKACHRLGLKWELKIWHPLTGEKIVVGSDTKAQSRKPASIEIELISISEVTRPGDSEKSAHQGDLDDRRGSTEESV